MYCDFNELVSDIRDCNENNCPSWTKWSPWSECSLTCGGGSKSRSRICALPDGTSPDGLYCPGEDTQKETCNENTCPGKIVLSIV